MSVAHRATGAALYGGTLLVALWLIAAASGPGAYDTAQAIAGSVLGRLVLFGYTFVLLHHMVGGLRHFMWDMGRGYEKHFNTKLAIVTPIVSVALTVLVWVVGYLAR